MTDECKHAYLEPSVKEIIQCSEDYILFRVVCVHCKMAGFAGGDIAWNLSHWPDEPPETDTRPHNIFHERNKAKMV